MHPGTVAESDQADWGGVGSHTVSLSRATQSSESSGPERARLREISLSDHSPICNGTCSAE